MSGFNNPFTVIPKAIWKSVKRKVTRHAPCDICKEKNHANDLEKDYLSRYVCKKCKEKYG